MYKLNEVAGVKTLTKKGKPVKKTDIKSFAEFGIKLIESGGSLADLPEEDENTPSLASIINYIDENLIEEKSAAETMRLATLKEQLHQATNLFRQNPNEINKELVVQLDKSYNSFLKQANMDSTLIVKKWNSLPDKFWEHIGPENPLPADKLRKYQEQAAKNT